MTAFREDAEFAAGADDDGIAIGPRGRVCPTRSTLQNVIEIVQKMQFWNDILQFRTAKRLKCHIISADQILSRERNPLKGRGLADVRNQCAGFVNQKGS